MTAKEMFERLGFSQGRIDDEEYNKHYILYTKDDIKIEFYKEWKSYNIWTESKMSNVYIYEFLNKAIYKQLEELEWLDEFN